MEGDDKKMEQLLRYLDGLMTTSEAAVFEREIRDDHELKNKLQEMREMELLLKSTRLPEPSDQFTTVVMRKIEAGPIVWRRIMNSLVLLFGVTIVAAVTAYLLANGTLDNSQTTIAIDRMQQLDKILPKVSPEVNLDGKLMMNVVIFLNLAVALIVLDRTVLKPFFQSRRTT